MRSKVVCLALAAIGVGGPGGLHAAEGQDELSAVCSLVPRVLDVRDRPGPLVARIELVGVDPARADVSGVHVRSVSGIPLPGPLEPAEGIDAAPSPARWEDRANAATGAAAPNGRRELVVRFDRPCDGDAATRDDGDAGDVLAMILDARDGATIQVCLGGSVDGASFQCCDLITVRNHGLRDLPGRRSP